MADSPIPRIRKRRTIGAIPSGGGVLFESPIAKMVIMRIAVSRNSLKNELATPMYAKGKVV